MEHFYDGRIQDKGKDYAAVGALLKTVYGKPDSKTTKGILTNALTVLDRYRDQLVPATYAAIQYQLLDAQNDLG